MQLSGNLYDFGDQTLAEHLRDIASELSEQACINGEDDPALNERPLAELAMLLEELASYAAAVQPDL